MFHIITISLRPVARISKSIGPIFAKFARLVEHDQSEIDFSNSRVEKLGRGNRFYKLYPEK